MGHAGRTHPLFALRAALILCVALIGSGCAVLTIDVDVYKGPLANHERVQTEQVAAMAIGAKPLLIQLRDRLEQRFNGEFKSRNFPRSGYIPPTDYQFQDAQAERVNGVLALYDDRFPEELSSLVKEGGAKFKTLTEAFYIVRPIRDQDQQEEKKRWEQIERGLKQGLAEALDKLRKAYQSFLLGAERRDGKAWRNQDAIFDIHLELEKHVKDLKPLKDILGVDRGMASANLEFHVLRAGELVEIHANLLFRPDAHEERRLFVSRVQKIGDAFLRAREATEELLHLTLKGLTVIPNIPKRRLTVPAERLYRTGAEFAASLVSPKDLWFALENEEVVRFQEAFLKRVTPELYHERRLSPHDPAFKRGFIEALLEAVETNTHALILTHLTYLRGYKPPGPEKDRAKPGGKTLEKPECALECARKQRGDAKSWYRSYGIATGPEDLPEVETVAELLRGFTAEAAAGLERGRLIYGLETLIERYLDAHQTYAPDDKRTVSARNHLLDELVRFAEKVLVIANNEILLRDAEGISNTNAGKYVRVLQAVGNSILTQVDDLRHSATHQDELKKAGDLELAGLRNAEAVLPPATLDRILSEMEPRAAALPGLIEAVKKTKGDAASLQAVLRATLEAQQRGLNAKTDTEQEFRTAWSVLTETWVADAVAGPATTTAAMTESLTRLLLEREGEASRRPGTDHPEAKRFQTAAKVLADLRKDLAAVPDVQGTGRVVLDDRLLWIRRNLEAAEAARKGVQALVADLTRWRDLVARMLTPSRVVNLPPGRQQKDLSARDVTDTMLATLRYEHVNAVRDHGADSEIAKQLAAAVELNYAHRSGMVYIRPASFYLRNSYPATVLQADPSFGIWRNMLTDQALRQLPFYGFVRGQEEAATINRTIDKQFWQNVNQVRLAGAGNTNYAIAKDDVGNWYVKSYSTEVDDIIRSAKNLALFAAGPSLGATFRPTGITGAAAQGPAGAPTAKAARSTLARQFEKFTARYHEETLRAYTDLKRAAKDLPKTILSAVRVEVRDPAQLTALDQQILTRLATDDTAGMAALAVDPKPEDAKKTPAELNSAVLAGLRIIKRYSDNVQSEIDAKTESGPADPSKPLKPETAAAAKRKTVETIRDLLNLVIAERQTSVAQYESAVLIIGETAGLPRESPAPSSSSLTR